jgi:hypothetical protein
MEVRGNEYRSFVGKILGTKMDHFKTDLRKTVCDVNWSNGGAVLVMSAFGF